MTKPVWEEEWVLFDASRACEYAPGIYIAGTGPDKCFSNFDDNHQARLASAAPDMARLLREHEYIVSGSNRDDDECFNCAAKRFDAHKPDCEWLRVMKKAGVR